MNLLRSSSLPVLSRREMLKMSAAVIAASAFAGSSSAKTQVNWLGWQGYDTPLKTEGFLEKNDIELAATYLANNDEIFTKLAAQAPIDIVTPYMGYVPGLREAGLIQSIDTSKVPNLPNVFPVFRDDSNLSVDGVHWSVPHTWGGGPMVYDPAVLTPTSWFDIEKPEYKGKIAMHGRRRRHDAHRIDHGERRRGRLADQPGEARRAEEVSDQAEEGSRPRYLPILR